MLSLTHAVTVTASATRVAAQRLLLRGMSAASAAPAPAPPAVSIPAAPEAPSASPTPSPKRVRVYTRTGDGGTSSLYNGTRAPKDDARFVALGDVDELNAAVGVARDAAASSGLHSLVHQLGEVQSRLLDAGSSIATPPDSSSAAQLARAAFPRGQAALLEGWIDEMDDTLPPLRNFILPSGGPAATALHVARTVARRAERAVVTTPGTEEELRVWLNRLSDYLFVAARWAASQTGGQEVVYKKARE